MLMPSKFGGRCAKCGGPLARGEQIDYRDKKAFHPVCAEEDLPTLEDLAEGHEVADRLGFRTTEQLERDGIPETWKSLSVLCRRTRDDAGRDAGPTLFQ